MWRHRRRNTATCGFTRAFTLKRGCFLSRWTITWNDSSWFLFCHFFLSACWSEVKEFDNKTTIINQTARTEACWEAVNKENTLVRTWFAFYLILLPMKLLLWRVFNTQMVLRGKRLLPGLRIFLEGLRCVFTNGDCPLTSMLLTGRSCSGMTHCRIFLLRGWGLDFCSAPTSVSALPSFIMWQSSCRMCVL